MLYTVSDVLSDVAGYINQDTTLPTGTELTTWINLINQAQQEWGNSYQWKELRVDKYSPSFGLSFTSLALPSNFKKLMSPVYDMSKTSSNKYLEIPPSDRHLKTSDQKYCYFVGNDLTGKALVINPALPSGASIVFDYQAFPSSVASTTDVLTCPNRQFIVKRVEAYILSSRSDPRFPLVKAEADNSLANMIEEEAAKSGGMNNQTKNYYRQVNFRIGE